MSFDAIQACIRNSNTRCLLSGLALSLILSGCSSAPSGGVQVLDRNGRPVPITSKQPHVTSGQYLVRRGDTLYSIAFRFGWDWKELAARNGIPAPYLLRVGQPIRFDGKKPSSVVAKSSSSTRTVRPTTSSSTAKPVVKKPPVTAKPVQSVSGTSSGWTWPTKGLVIGRFSSNGSLNKGIDIAGDLGQPVLAASDGSVVYAGSGLRGYGELVIIKHSSTYVSAYGHNRRLLVKEGQKVKAGQAIAEMGSTGTDRVKLHFEIRRQGKPVDPLQFLPRQ
ncbi:MULTISPECIES: peptidoglycan DD-metalloendopeptidase family protein [Pseudomonas]|uniref:Lipoprotein NlpD n=1 Tax=Pseudomonas segetis TaxID=298908 RepID=A0A239C3C0_9PSED|nr:MULTISPECIES: peptidoglycan DD-metalloendopeptidase family protein [Pseudomonas]SNS14785.1 lipoprotein NlpD [Pseudomonas segetis]